ncbi:VOC family protein [Paeniglutamicibacter sulfureus]|uniref:PhnB protein n=1 Tax=Paeniglutamicibacter sulfureus TaxID=43666 RepID=A0ABU2BKS1_9MICC|nr:VOC family protein [Paeniglutamicibacter sulfureus]MDR7359236.1 PhnB protein [Paeniglutamicibacter sulfureus]
MGTILNPYISFRDTARPALEFYQSIFGGELDLRPFADFDFAKTGNPEDDNKIMHGHLRAPNGLNLMAADTPASMEWKGGTAISVTLSGDDKDEMTTYWKKLSEGATIGEELAEAPWGDSFGMLADKFGVDWMVNIAGPGNTGQ